MEDRQFKRGRMAVPRRLAIGATLAAMTMPGCARAAAPAEKVLRYVPEFDLRSLDPIVDTGLTTLQHGYMIYDTLFAMDTALRPRPQMVGTYGVSTDELIHEFGLRPGLFFHDGLPVRARDCIASIKRWAVRDVMGRVLLSRTTSLDVVDESTFRLTLTRPFPMLLQALAKISASPCFIMRAQDAETDPFQTVTTSVGSGPFRFLRAEHVPGAMVAYERNATYNSRHEPSDGYAGAKQAMVERVEWRSLPDAAMRAQALLAGEVDIVSSLPFELLPMMQQRADIKVEALDGLGWMMYIRPNQLFPPFSDVRARRALACLVDQSEYTALAAGSGQFGHEDWSFLADGAAPASSGPEAFGKPDLGRAKALMQEAGYDGEPIVVLDPVDNILLSSITALTVSQLRKIGVNVRPVTQDLASMIIQRVSHALPGAGGWHLFHGRSLSIEMSNPLTNFPLASPCGLDRASGWFGWPCAPALEALRRSWADVSDDAERHGLIDQLQQAAALTLPFVPLGRVELPVVHQAHVTRLVQMPVPVFWRLQIESS